MTESNAGLIVVAGATGYLGSHVARVLSRRGYRVRALVRDADRLGPAAESFHEVFVGQATRPETLSGLADGALAVFSAIGLRQLARRPSFWEVDRDANLALVEEAERARVPRFVLTSVWGGDRRRDIPLFEAKEQVVDRLRSSTLRSTVLRPTGLFNDMEEFHRMAASGRMWLFGDGSAAVNPIHGADVGDAVAELLAQTEPPSEVTLGGPETFTLREIGNLAFESLHRPPRYGALPVGLLRAAARLAGPFNANLASILEGFHFVNTEGGVAPARGSRRLGSFFDELSRPSLEAESLEAG